MTDSTAPRDHLTRFLLPRAGVRGVHVHLGDTWQRIAASDDYPTGVRNLLGEAAVASALFTGHVKVDGRLSIQLRGEAGLRTLFAECTAGGTLRGIARLADGDGGGGVHGLGDAGDDALLAITIENPGFGSRETSRYQGIVPLDSPVLSQAFEDYFVQSEQLPTRILLAAGAGEACGLMLQKLPADGGDDDGWARVSALFSTLGEEELLAVPGAALLHRLFHEEAPELVGGRPLAFGCSCSRERVEAMLVSLGREEAEAALVDGTATVRCEFCGQAYRFGPAEVHALFTTPAHPMAAPPGLH